MGLAIWENGYIALPFFEPTLGRVKSSVPHGT
jgi:hypothetical protein